MFGGLDWLGDWLNGLLKAAVICKVNSASVLPPLPGAGSLEPSECLDSKVPNP